MLLLGRLDGRLLDSPVADIFLARARLSGAAELARLAGVPVDVHDLQSWIAGRTPPPRASEGLNDPISIAAVFHIALISDEEAGSPIGHATLRTLRSILDDRHEAETFGSEDLAHFGPLWRSVRKAADAPYPAADLPAIAQRIYDLAALTDPAPSSSTTVVTIDGRMLDISTGGRDRMWLIGTALPQMLYRAGLTMQRIPSLVLLPKLLPPSPAELTDILIRRLGETAAAGLQELDEIERAARRQLGVSRVTRRSHAPTLARLSIAYPGLRPAAVARLLKITPQGARKLLKSLEASRSDDR